MSTGDIVQSVVKGIADGVEIANTFHFMMGVGSPPPDLVGMASNFLAVYGGPMLGILNATYSGVEIVHTVVAGVNIGLQYLDTTWLGQTGAVTGFAAPLTQCYVGQRRTGFARRTGRGRVFLSPINRGTFDETGAYLAIPPGEVAFLNAIISAVTDTNPASYAACLYNRATHVATAIASAERSLRAGNQRHRRVSV
jgi:hypothetical protein